MLPVRVGAWGTSRLDGRHGVSWCWAAGSARCCRRRRIAVLAWCRWRCRACNKEKRALTLHVAYDGSANPGAGASRTFWNDGTAFVHNISGGTALHRVTRRTASSEPNLSPSLRDMRPTSGAARTPRLLASWQCRGRGPLRAQRRRSPALDGNLTCDCDLPMGLPIHYAVSGTFAAAEDRAPLTSHPSAPNTPCSRWCDPSRQAAGVPNR
jgi:hypothetical protein